MYYVNQTASESGNHGNPVSVQSEGMVGLPDELLSEYIQTKGFANFTIEDGVINSVAINQSAYDAYVAQYPDVPEEPSEEEDLLGMAIDHEYRITLLELGLTDM